MEKSNNCLRHKSKLSDERNESFKDTFDHIKAVLDIIEDLFKVILKRINSMLKVIDVTNTNK